MARLILFVFLFLLFYAIFHYLIKDMFRQRKRSNQELEPEELAQDPSCQIYIPKRTAVRKRVEGKDYYFCSKDCVRKFVDEKKSQNPKDRGQRLGQ